MRVKRAIAMTCGSVLLAGVAVPAISDKLHAEVAYTKSRDDTTRYDSTNSGKCAPGCDCGPVQSKPPPIKQARPPVQAQQPPPPAQAQQSPTPAQQTSSPGGLGGNAVNLAGVPLTFAAQGEVAEISAMGFASTLFGRLDLFRAQYGYAPPVALPVKAPRYTKAPRAVVRPWSVYMQANGGVSDRQATAASDGFHLDSVGGTIGTETASTPIQSLAPRSTMQVSMRICSTMRARQKPIPTNLAFMAAGRTSTCSPRGSLPSAIRIIATPGSGRARPSPQIRMDQPS